MKNNIIIQDTIISKRVTEIANEINNDYKDIDLDIICLGNSATRFYESLIDRIKLPFKSHNLKFDNYNSMNVSGEVRLTSDINVPLFNANVLIVEAIVVSGNTPNYIFKLLQARNPKSLNFCVLGIKPHLLNNKLPLKYVAFELDKRIAVGYGVGDKCEKKSPHLIEKN